MALDFPIFPTSGQTYSSGGQTWTFNGSGWASTYQASGVVRQIFTATASQTSFTVVGGYLANLVDVYQNGVKLVNGTDVTVTSGTAVVLATGATVGDFVEVIGISAFAVANYLPLAGGTMTGALLGTTATFSGAVSGTTGTFSAAVSGTTGTFTGSATATALIPSGSTVPSNGMYLSAANTLNLATNTTNQVSISSTGIVTGTAGNLMLVQNTSRITLSSTATVISTAIPSWAKRIILNLAGVTTSGTSPMIVQIGSGSYTSTGYLGSCTALASSGASANATSGFPISTNDGATQVAHVTMTINLQNAATNTWVSAHSGGCSNRAQSLFGGGSVSLGGTLDRLQITTVNGTDTFTAGTINFQYE